MTMNDGRIATDSRASELRWIRPGRRIRPRRNTNPGNQQMNSRVSLAIAAIAIAASGTYAKAQLPIPSFAVVGGVSHYNLASSGSTPFGALRVDIPLLTLVAEGSLGALRPDDGGVRRTFIVPEAQLQYQLLPVLVRPYVGVGAGWFRNISGPDPKTNEMTYSASVGVRATLPLTGLGFRGEIRTRGIGGFHRRATEFTLGLSL